MELFLVPSGQTMQVFSGHTGPVQAGTFTPDGKRLLTASEDGSLILGILALPHLYGNSLPRTPVLAWLNGINVFGRERSRDGRRGRRRQRGGARNQINKGEVLGKLEGHSEGKALKHRILGTRRRFRPMQGS